MVFEDDRSNDATFKCQKSKMAADAYTKNSHNFVTIEPAIRTTIFVFLLPSSLLSRFFCYRGDIAITRVCLFVGWLVDSFVRSFGKLS